MGNFDPFECAMVEICFSQNMTQAQSERKNNLKPAISLWLLLTGSYGFTFYSLGRSSLLVRCASVLVQVSEIDQFVQFMGSLSSCLQSSEDSDTRLPFRVFLLFRHMSSQVSSFCSRIPWSAIQTAIVDRSHCSVVICAFF